MFAGVSNVKCFNGGGPHPVMECSQPIDPACIKANEKVFWATHKKAKGHPLSALHLVPTPQLQVAATRKEGML